MVNCSLLGGVLIGALVRQAQLEQSCNQQAGQESYDGNHQHLYFLLHYIQKVGWNVLCNVHQLLETQQRALQWLYRSKPSWQWLHMIHLPQSCWTHWVPHATACVQGTYVICCIKGIRWRCGMFLPRDIIIWLVVEGIRMLVEFHHWYNDFNRINSYGGRLELWLFVYLAVQTRYILQTIQVTWWNGQYIWVSEISARQFDQSLPVLHVSLLPFFQFLRNITFKDMEQLLLRRNNISTIVKL